MTRALAYVETIRDLKPIPGADKIECATILGWELVVKKGEFKVGDLAVYCEIDSVMPQLPHFEFLRSRKFRIKTILMRSQISQGIAFPLSVVNEIDPTIDISSLKVGDDLTDI
jgi:RNA ligase (TIGR02306 family)